MCVFSGGEVHSLVLYADILLLLVSDAFRRLNDELCFSIVSLTEPSQTHWWHLQNKIKPSVSFQNM